MKTKGKEKDPLGSKRTIFFRLLSLRTAASILIGIISHISVQAQFADADYNVESPINEERLRIVFYNAENLFDTDDDPSHIDEAFTPDGLRNWTYWKYRKKLNNLARVLIHTGGWELPAIICMAEIENRRVLEDLLKYSPLLGSGYEIVHFDSEDRRGIDVALLYRPDKIPLRFAKALRIRFPENPGKRSRDILHCRFLLQDSIPLHLFVNHWPSKFGGEQATIPFRLEAAHTLSTSIKSISLKEKNARILCCGDFNDGPADESLEYLNNLKEPVLVNLMSELAKRDEGTHKFAGFWSIIDQFIVSENLRYPKHSCRIQCSDAVIFKAPYLFEEEVNQTGHRPFRSFAGTFFQAGYSDHLPVYVDIIMLK